MTSRWPIGSACLLSCLLAVAMGPLAAPVAGDGPQPVVRVVFLDGAVLEVAGVEVDGPQLALDLGDGSEMTVPLARLSHWHVPEPEPLRVGRDRTPPLAAGTAARVPDATWSREAGDHAATIFDAAERYRLHPELLTAVARVESAFDPRAVSPVGAQGLLQLMPATAKRFGVSDPFDADQNVGGGARYLSWLLDRFDDRLDLALAGYNAGENAVERHGGVPPYRETRNYVHRVLHHAQRYGLELVPVE